MQSRLARHPQYKMVDGARHICDAFHNSITTDLLYIGGKQIKEIVFRPLPGKDDIKWRFQMKINSISKDVTPDPSWCSWDAYKSIIDLTNTTTFSCFIGRFMSLGLQKHLPLLRKIRAHETRLHKKEVVFEFLPNLEDRKIYNPTTHILLLDF